jgi:hypothetical protein
MRSLFSFDQFEQVLQKLAHTIAIEAITNLRGDIRIVVHGGRLSQVETDKHSISFYAKHASYFERPGKKYEDWWGFDVEEKLYSTSDHSTKISFNAYEGKEKETAEKITDFIEKLMSEASIKPVPRFSLTEHTQKC